MSQKMLIDASHNEETRVVVLESKKVEDFDFESLKKLQLSGNIYLAKVTRVEPSLQAAFLDYGGNRHGFLAFSEIHPDYYQIPLEEREKVETDSGKVNQKNDKSRAVSRKKVSKVKAAENNSDDNSSVVGENILDNDIPPTSKLSVKNNENEDDRSSRADDLTDLSNEDLKNEDSNTEETAFKRQHRKFRIQEVIKVRQILLIQIVKEERGNKGAALTTYLSLAGRYCVLMPNTPRGGGISRKITNLPDRKKLKEIANSLSVPEGSGLIIRTAGSNRTKLEIKRDYEYLIRQWEQVRDLTLSSIAPTTIYEEGSLIKRAIRDLYSRSIDEIVVEGERGYKEAKEYMKMLMPSHAKNVKKYEQDIPLFTKYQVEDHLAAMFNPIAQLKSGGYIVINVTEALVAVDVNSGRATKETSIEDTALKTNLEAADELARQIRLRDLAGLIVIDFIDMEDRKNNIAVERRMKDRLKTDRARTQVGRISIFGLLEMSRQRLRPGMIETSTQACSHCHGTGITRSDDSLSLAILRELEEDGIKNVYSILKLQAPINISNYMLNEKRERIATIEARYKLSIKIEALSELISPEYRIERVKGGTNISTQNNNANPETKKTNDVQPEIIKEERETTENSKVDEVNLDETQNKRRRRRRRKPKPKPGSIVAQTESEINSQNVTERDALNNAPDIEESTSKSKKKQKESPITVEKEKDKNGKEPRKLTSKNKAKPVAKTSGLEKKLNAKKKPLERPKNKVTATKTRRESQKEPKNNKNLRSNESVTTTEPLVEEHTATENNQRVSKRKGWWSISNKNE